MIQVSRDSEISGTPRIGLVFYVYSTQNQDETPKIPWNISIHVVFPEAPVFFSYQTA